MAWSAAPSCQGLWELGWEPEGDAPQAERPTGQAVMQPEGT